MLLPAEYLLKSELAHKRETHKQLYCEYEFENAPYIHTSSLLYQLTHSNPVDVEYLIIAGLYCLSTQEKSKNIPILSTSVLFSLIVLPIPYICLKISTNT